MSRALRAVRSAAWTAALCAMAILIALALAGRLPTAAAVLLTVATCWGLGWRGRVDWLLLLGLAGLGGIVADAASLPIPRPAGQPWLAGWGLLACAALVLVSRRPEDQSRGCVASA